ncbi:hypothetical protein [Actinomadura hibisca]|uniref:hypothetical protein n=1 Tax=Actinomadura hibisca TaxID=68565 RepID=UPI0012FCDB3B|nr:hypothetical protein [Actinomadura hibisca]
MDTVLLLQEPGRKRIVIIESQTKPDAKKRRSWPYYIAYLHELYECPITLIVVCSDTATAAWARSPIVIKDPDDGDEYAVMTVYPRVLGPDNVPVIRTLAEAVEDVPFTVLAAITHGRSRSVDAILDVVEQALDTIDVDFAAVLAEHLELGLTGTKAQTIWRAKMSAQTYRFQSEYAQQLREEGREEGRLEGEARSVLRVLDRRSVRVPDSVRAQILSCEDEETVQNWLDRALTANSVEDLFTT